MSDVGRPTSFKEEYVELVYNYCLLGATDVKLSEFFGVCEKTLNNWKKDYPHFLQSIRKGKEIADSQIANALFHRAKGYKHRETKIATYEGVISDEKEYDKHYPPDVKACQFWLKNRQPELWREKMEVDHTTDGKPITGFEIQEPE